MIAPSSTAVILGYPDKREILTVRWSEDQIALEFTIRHGATWRYVAKWNRWMYWNGSSWREDEKLSAFNLAREMCRELALVENDQKPKQVAARTVGGVLSLARTDPQHAASVDQWDANPNLLGCPNITVDLETAEEYEPLPEDCITCLTAATPEGDCLNWYAFLDRVTGGDKELQEYLQRAVGYCLTGLTSEHVLFFLYGTGANGKSVCINTIAGVMGDYAATAPTEVFVASQSDRHPTELARLRGARLVNATETEAGQQWAEAKIKALTGGDVITARFMRQDFFEFTPQFKLMIAGNHKPALRTVDEAIRRRIHLVPFTVTIPEAERDPDLTENLKAEWHGILNWAVNGTLKWRQQGLNPPKAVRDATDEYLTEQDSLAEFIADACETGPEYWSKSTRLFGAWKFFATARNETVGTQKAFTQAMKGVGYETKHDREGTKFLRIQPKPEFEWTP